MSYLLHNGFLPPNDLVEYKLSLDSIDHFRINNYAKFLHAFTIPEILETPQVIFKGLEREEQEDGLCYCGVPKYRYVNDHQTTVPPPPGFTFLVFITKSRVIFDWRWEKIDANLPAFPENHLTRFAKILWQPSTNILKPTKM